MYTMPQPLTAAAPLTRPFAITATISAHILFGFVALLMFFAHPGTMTLVPVGVTFGIAAALRFRPGAVVRTIATIYAALWALTVIALPISAAILYALWNRESSDYLRVADDQRR